MTLWTEEEEKREPLKVVTGDGECCDLHGGKVDKAIRFTFVFTDEYDYVQGRVCEECLSKALAMLRELELPGTYHGRPDGGMRMRSDGDDREWL